MRAVRKNLAVVAAVLLVAGCTSRVAGLDAPPRTREGPTREQVLQADGLCVADTQLASEIADARSLATGRDEEYRLGTDYYLRFVASTVTTLADTVNTLTDSGTEPADAYASALAAELSRIAPEVTRLAGESWEVSQLPEQTRLDRVRQITDQFDSLDTDGVDVLSLARKDPEFAWAYDLAPNCAPLTVPSAESSPAPSSPPPADVSPTEAEDGTDLAACADGTCEVAITDSATVTVADFTLDITVADDQVTTVEQFPSGATGTSSLGGVGGEVSFGDTERTVTLQLVGLEGNTAVLRFSVS